MIYTLELVLVVSCSNDCQERTWLRLNYVAITEQPLFVSLMHFLLLRSAKSSLMTTWKACFKKVAPSQAGHWIWCSRRSDGLSVAFHLQIPGLSVRWRLVLAFLTNAYHACTVSLYSRAKRGNRSQAHFIHQGFVLGASYAVRYTKVRKLVSSREQTTCQIETHTLRLIMTSPICWLKCPGSGFQSMWTYSLEWPGSSLYSTWPFCYPSTEI